MKLGKFSSYVFDFCFVFFIWKLCSQQVVGFLFFLDFCCTKKIEQFVEVDNKMSKVKSIGMWWKSLKGLRASPYWFHFFKFGILEILLCWFWVIGYWKEVKLCTWELWGKMGPWVGNPTFVWGYIFNFYVAKVFDGDCFNTNFFEMLWVMVIVYVFKINIRGVCCDRIIIKDYLIVHENKLWAFWSHLCLRK